MVTDAIVRSKRIRTVGVGMTLMHGDIHRIVTLVYIIAMVTVSTETKRAVARKVTIRVGA